MRQYVKKESLVDIDGENNMLYELIKFQPVGERSFAEHLVANLPTQDTPKNARQNAEAFFSKQFEEMPLLSIGVPVHLNEWDAETFVPLVAVGLSDYDDQTSQYIRAYDATGKLHLLTLKEAPDVPTVTVRMNERIESRGKLAGKLMYEASDFVPKTREFSLAVRAFDDHILSRISYAKVTESISAKICGPGESPPGCDPEPGPGNPTPVPPPPCKSRNCKSGNDKIYSFRFNSTTSFKELESWYDRDIELYVRVFVQNLPLNPLRVQFGDSNGKLHYNNLQNCPNNCSSKLYIANKSMNFQWNEATHGRYIGFRWMEYDEANTRTTSYSYTPCDGCPTVNISFSETEEDDYIDERLVDYRSDLNSPLAINRMYFTLNR